jgi:glucuronate isomerase
VKPGPTDAISLLLAPGHYLYRMLYSQGVRLEDLGVPAHGRPSEADPRAAWRIFAANQHLYRGTPSRMSGWTMCLRRCSARREAYKP